MIANSRGGVYRTSSFLALSIQAVGFLVLAAFVGVAARLPADQLLSGSDSVVSPGAIRILMVALALAILASSIYLARRSVAVAPYKFLMIAIAGAVAIKALLIATVEPRWGGDFLRYWDNAQAMVENGSLKAGTSIYKQRASLIFYPVYKLFGDTPLALKVINALGAMITAALAYDILRIVRNHQAAQAFVVLFLLCPMPAFDALFPSHDLWGTVFFVAALWSMTRASYIPAGTKMRWLRTAGHAGVCAVFVVLLEVQRGAASMLPLAMVITAILLLPMRTLKENWSGGWQPERRAPLVVALIVLVAFIPLNFTAEQLGFKKSTLVDHARAATLMKMAAHGGVFSNARSATWVRFDERFTEKRAQGSAAVADFGQSIVLSSWADPDGGKFRLIRAVSPRLFQLGYPSDWDVALRAPQGMSQGTRGALISYTNAYGIVLALATAIALLLAALSQRTPPLPILLSLVFTLLLAASLLGFFENKPPNLYSAWIAYLMLTAWLASTTPADSGLVTRRGMAASFLGIFLLVAGYIGARTALDSLYEAEDGRIITDWNVTSRSANGGPKALQPVDPYPLGFNSDYYAEGSIKDWIIEDAGNDSKRLAKYASDFFTIMELSLPIKVGDRAVMSKIVCTQSSRTALEFFLFAAYERRSRPQSFTFEVSVDGKVAKRISIPLEGRNFRLVEVDGMFSRPGCQNVELAVVSNVARTADSWRRASHVEVWNPRLIERPTLGGTK